MKEKNRLVLKLIDDLKKQFEENGYNISDETYKMVCSKYLNSDMPFEEIKKELFELVNEKLNSLKSAHEKERLKNFNLEDCKNENLTIKSLDIYGYPNIINTKIDILKKIDIGHNAPINVQFGNRNGFYKNSAHNTSSSLDKFEYVVCQIGKMFNVKMAETHKVSLGNQPLGIISENVCKTNETLYMYSEITKFIDKDTPEFQNLKNELERISSNTKRDSKFNISMVENPDDIKLVIDSFLNVTNSFKISEEAKRNIRQDYFNMIMLDFLVNNVDRNKNNYGLIINEYGEVKFSPIFDNSTIDIPDMPKGYQQINGFLINKNKLLNSLYEHYYDDIKNITQVCLHNQDTVINKVTDLCTSELNSKEQNWFLGNFSANLNLVADKELSKQENRNTDSGLITEEVKTSVINHPVEQSTFTQPESKENKEEGPKLVRRKPENSNSKNDKPINNDGKINFIMILLLISSALILTTLIILFNIQ